MIMKRVACLWFPAWPIQRLVAARPELRGRGIVLHAATSRPGQCVVACSQAAYQVGVRPGMSIAEMSALLPRGTDRTVNVSSPTAASCRNVPRREEPYYIARHQRDEDRKALLRLAAECEHFSPLVGFETTPGVSEARWQTVPACLCLDVTNIAEHFGGETMLAQTMARFMERRGYRVRIALADTVGAAWAGAHFGAAWAKTLNEASGHREGKSWPARSSYWVIASGTLPSALLPLPIEALRLDHAAIGDLQHLGIFRIRQLTALPRAALAARFGAQLVQRLDQAFGQVEELIEPYRATPAFRREYHLERPTKNRRVIEEIERRLIQQLCHVLATHGQGVFELVCRCQCEMAAVATLAAKTETAANHVQLQVGLARPTVAADHLFELIRLRAERIVLPGPVTSIEIRITRSGPLETRQRLLFSDADRPEPQSFTRLVDRLAGRLGRAAVVRPHLEPDRQPEHAYLYEPVVTGPKHARRKSNRLTRDLRRFVMRPLSLRSPPVSLGHLETRPNGSPLCFYLEQKKYRVVRHWGPERIETGWWRGRSVRRDYYRVETEGGQHFWLFRRREDGQWFLHGIYE